MNIQANDIVKHIPSGEEWVVCGANYNLGTLIPCGYPFPTIANISDCELLEKRNMPQTIEQAAALIYHGFNSYMEL